MEWINLLIAGVFEIAWAIGLKYSVGLTKPIPSVITIITMLLSFYFLALAVKNLPIGMSYAIWTGIGTVGTAILSIILFKEPVNAIKIICIGLILSGITGLKLISS